MVHSVVANHISLRAA